MKSALVLALGLFIGSNTFAAVTDGEYTCSSKNDKIQFVFNLKTVTTDGVALPFVEVTKTYFADGNEPTRTYKVKGIATSFIDDQGVESLSLGNMMITLTQGRPSCAK